MPLPTLSAVAPDGTARTFYYELEETTEPNSNGPYAPPIPVLHLSVHKVDDPSMEDRTRDLWFEASFAEDGSDRMRVTMLDNRNKPHYRGKGITEALFELVARRSQPRVLVSSSNVGAPESGQYRTEAATKVWRRLEEAGKAVYDEAEDRFTYTLP